MELGVPWVPLPIHIKQTMFPNVKIDNPSNFLVIIKN